jgi:adenine phosphoribosyltransferase
VSQIDYAKLIVDIPDYPEPGVVFKDITPLLSDPQGFAAVIDDISEHFIGRGITKVVGAEARGFLIGTPVAYRLGAGFVPARKPGKLPREVYSQSYALEYGTDELQIHKDALTPDDRVLLVDDLVATGGTAVASAKLVEQTGAQVVGFAFALELAFLKPRDIIGKDFDQEVFSLIQVD